jgi:hypothetical protein
LSLIRDEIATQSAEAGRTVRWRGPAVTTKLVLVHPPIAPAIRSSAAQRCAAAGVARGQLADFADR